ncbi:MAG: hypothetical protein JXB30_16080, partial [Anaerolineae bacterium]|nr:hypothetical protein [Anaerolineae bacterium]
FNLLHLEGAILPLAPNVRTVIRSMTWRAFLEPPLTSQSGSSTTAAHCYELVGVQSVALSTL